MRKIKAHYNIEPGEDGYYTFSCPGCERHHSVPLTKQGQTDHSWGWNGDMEFPTILPSILVNQGRMNPADHICHSYVIDGKIQFLSDCTHHLAGKTVNMREIY